MARYMALLERFPHGTFFVKQCEKLPTTSQHNARKLAEQWAKEQATERPVVLHILQRPDSISTSQQKRRCATASKHWEKHNGQLRLH